MADLRLFRQFIAVAEESSFRRAAERLHMAQPPLTAAIKRLEDELGVRLIVRTNRITALTTAGEVFLEEARKTIKQAEWTLQRTRNTASGLSGLLRLGFVASTVRHVLPDIVINFRTRHPDVVLELTEATTSQQVNSLFQNNLDAGIVVMPVPVGTVAHIATKTIKRGNLIVALPEHHPLARQEQLTLAELAGSAWISFPESEGPGLFNRITNACAVSGFAPVIVQRAVQMETIIGLVAAQMGIALVPENMNHHGWQGVAFRALAGPGTPIPYHLALAWRKNDITTTLHALIDVISESD